jgi:hypothetical protein
MTYEAAAVSEDWPVADFDPVRQLRVIAAVTPGARIHERVIDAPFAAVWEVAADLERMPQWLPDIRSVRYRGTEALVVGHSRLRARFDVEKSSGWCLMRSRFLLGGMAARSEEEGTRWNRCWVRSSPAPNPVRLVVSRRWCGGVDGSVGGSVGGSVDGAVGCEGPVEQVEGIRAGVPEAGAAERQQ